MRRREIREDSLNWWDRNGLRPTPRSNGVCCVFVAVSTRCFADHPFAEACAQLVDLEFDKVEIWMDESSPHLRVSEVADDPDGFVARYRETTRMPPVAFTAAHDLDLRELLGVTKAAKQLRVTQVTIPASPLGTPFNAEIERLRELTQVARQDGVRLSIRTESNKLTEDAHTAVELCGAVPGLGLSLDPSFFLRRPTSERAMDLVLEQTYHVHLRDSTAQDLQVQVGLGQVDYSKLVVQLRRVGYDRALSIEFLPELMDISQRPLELRKMRMLLESLL
jgi:sugar phosphate isomerase/epimerase